VSPTPPRSHAAFARHRARVPPRSHAPAVHTAVVARCIASAMASTPSAATASTPSVLPTRRRALVTTLWLASSLAARTGACSLGSSWWACGCATRAAATRRRRRGAVLGASVASTRRRRRCAARSRRRIASTKLCPSTRRTATLARRPLGRRPTRPRRRCARACPTRACRRTRAGGCRQTRARASCGSPLGSATTRCSEVRAAARVDRECPCASVSSHHVRRGGQRGMSSRSGELDLTR
jgi:hypothetical protein